MLGNKPSKKKIQYPVKNALLEYLEKYNRATQLPLQYNDMSRYISSIPLRNADGKDTLWETVFYEENELKEINDACCQIYALLKTDGDLNVMEHLSVARIDFCLFGNTQPYRVRIINKLNDNYDHFYIKRIDASRIYGLELECLLSPNIVNYLIDENTIIEEHIAGIPGDEFVKNNLNISDFEKTRIAKEFVKFNERCFARLLGDMRAYNFVMDITPDIEGNQYRLRTIDFDQQSYEGRKNFYLPQYFKENNKIIDLGFKYLSYESVRQYQSEERSLIARRARNEMERLNQLLKCMAKEKLSDDKKIAQLKTELEEHHKSGIFNGCTTMGELVFSSLKLILLKEFKQSIIKID